MPNHRHDSIWRRTALAACGGLCLLVATGCEKEQEAPKEVIAPPPPPKVYPLEEIELDPRVQFPDEREPSTVSLAQAVADLASAVIDGDSELMSSLLSREDREILDWMVEAGLWIEGDTGIELARVCVLNEGESGVEVALGILDAQAN
ncbi:MAG: hypothetical protein AAFX05_11810, partial [Planctomycetota bacterium]